MAIGDTSRDLQLEDGKGTINRVSEYVVSVWGLE
jgi:hypothetical protein